MNYGDWQDFLSLKNRWGIKKTEKFFNKMLNQKRCNLRKPVQVLFKEYFLEYA